MICAARTDEQSPGYRRNIQPCSWSCGPRGPPAVEGDHLCGASDDHHHATDATDCGMQASVRLDHSKRVRE
jgi:hypothetical protein